MKVMMNPTLLFLALAGCMQPEVQIKPAPTTAPASISTEKSIAITVVGHGCEKPGPYRAKTASLAAFIQSNPAGISPLVTTIHVKRYESEKMNGYVFKIEDIAHGKDFILKNDDVLFVGTPYL